MEELGFSLSLEQVNYEAKDVPLGSLDDDGQSLNSVVDANIEFQIKEGDRKLTTSPIEAFALGQIVHLLKETKRRGNKKRCDEAAVEETCAELQQVLIQKLQALESEGCGSKVARVIGIPQVHSSSAALVKSSRLKALPVDAKDSYSEIYPDIPPEVASYLTEKDPSLLPRLTAALNSVQTPDDCNTRVSAAELRGRLSCSFQSMTDASEMFALQVSDLGQRSQINSAPEVILSGDMLEKETSTKSSHDSSCATTTNGNQNLLFDNHVSLSRTDSSSSTSTLESEVFPSSSASTPLHHIDGDAVAKSPKRLHRYPSDKITILVEKKSYLEPDADKPGSNSKRQSKKSSLFRRRGSVSSAASSADSATDGKSAGGRVSEQPSLNDSQFMNTSLPPASIINDLESPSLSSLKSIDKLETSSNLSGYSSNPDCFELDSNYSEKLETLSNFSDVSGYEEEMFRIKKLLLDPSSPVEFPRKVPMKVASKKDSQRKVAKISPAQHLFPSLACHPEHEDQGVASELRLKCNHLLQDKLHLQGQLESLKEELQTIHASRSQLQVQVVGLENSLKSHQQSTSVQVERDQYAEKVEKLSGIVKALSLQVQESMSRYESKEAEAKMWKEELTEMEGANERLRINVEELRMECDAKEGAVQGLKGKIAELYVEAQNALRAKLKAENDLESSRNQLQSMQKSRDWYQEQRALLQVTRSKLQQELMASQSEALNQRNAVEKHKSEMSHLHQQHLESQQRAMKEKESLLRHLETIQADMQEREALFEQLQKDKGVAEESIMLRMKKLEEEKAQQSSANFTLVDLQHKLEASEAELKEKAEMIQALESDRAEMLKRLTTFQKMASEKELMYQSLENKNQQLEMLCKQLKEQMRDSERSLKLLQTEKVNAELALSVCNKDKQEVDCAVEKLRQDFVRISSNFQKMKHDLGQKDRALASLDQEKSAMESRLKSREERVHELENLLGNAMQNQQKLSALEKMETTVEQLRRQNKDLGYKIADVTQDRSRIQREMCKLEEKLKIREQQLVNQHHGFEASFGDVQEKEKMLDDLIKEKGEWQGNLSLQRNRVQLLQQEVESLVAEKLQLSEELLGMKTSHEETSSMLKKVMEEKAKLEETTLLLRSEVDRLCSLEKTRVKVDGTAQTNCQVEQESEGNAMDFSRKKFEACQQELTEALGLKRELNGELRKAQEERRAIELEMQEMRSEREHLHNIQNGLEERLRFVERDRESYDEKLEGLVRERDWLQQELSLHVMKNVHDRDSQVAETDERCRKEEEEEIQKLREELMKMEGSYKEKQKKYESNIRVLLKKLKEHMKARKAAEKELAGIKEKDEDAAEFKLEITRLQEQCAEQEKKAEEAKHLALELEKIKGRLAGAMESHSTLQHHANSLEVELARREFMISELNSQVQESTQGREQSASHAEERICGLEEISVRDKKMIKDLRQQIFSDKRDNSRLKKQVYSLKVGLDTANQLVDSKKQQVSLLESQMEAQQESYQKLQSDFQDVSRQCENYREEVEELKRMLADSRAKDPMLADQLKTLGFHLHQKNQEVANLQAQLHTAEERQSAKVESLLGTVRSLKQDLQQLQRELEDVRQAKFSYQSQVAELRGALKSSVDQNKVLKMKLEALDDSEITVDLLATLPSPTKYDESCITQLLEQSTLLPQSRPLSDLKNCVNSLKHEMETLQKQLKVKTLQNDCSDSID